MNGINRKAGPVALLLAGAVIVSATSAIALTPPPKASLPSFAGHAHGVRSSRSVHRSRTDPAKRDGRFGSVRLPKVVATIAGIDQGAGGPYILDVNPVTNTLYAANYDDVGTVAQIDGRTNRVTARIPTGDDTNSATVNPFTNRVYASNYVDGTISVIDGRAKSVIATIPVGSGRLQPEGCEDDENCTSGAGPYQVAVNPWTNRIYVDNYFDGSVSVVDGRTNKTIATVPVSKEGPYGIAANPVINKIYVVDNPSGALTVIDGRTNRIEHSVTVGSNPLWVAVNPTTNRVYVTNNDDDTLSVLDGRTDTVIDTIALPPGPDPAACTTNCTDYGSIPVAVAVDQSSDRVYVTNLGRGSVTVIDGRADRVLGSVSVGSGAPDPVGCLFLTSCTATGSEPFALAVNQATGTIYDLNLADQTISVLAGHHGGRAGP